MRWFVEISALGKNPPPATTLCVEAPQWQPALQKARALRGDDGSMTNFSIELLDDGYRAIDPTARLRYVVRKAPDDAALSSNGVASPASAPRPGNGKKSGKTGSGRKTPVPPKASDKTPAPSPASGRQVPPCKLLSERSQEPSAKSPLTYRELAYAVPDDTTDEMAGALIQQRFEHVRDKMPVRPGRMVNLAVFDHEFTGKPQRPPLATLSWKDWKGDTPEVRFPRRDGPGNTPTPLAPFSAPPPSLIAALGSAPQTPESSSRTVQMAATSDAVPSAPAAAPAPPAAVAPSAPPAAPSAPPAAPSAPPVAVAAPAPPAAVAPSAPPAAPSAPPVAVAPSAPPTATSPIPPAQAKPASEPPPVSAGAPTAPAAIASAEARPPAPPEAPAAPPSASVESTPASSSAPTVQIPAREPAEAQRESVAPNTEPTATAAPAPSPSNAPSTQPSRDTTPGSAPIPGFSATPTPSAEIVEEVSVPIDITDTPAKATPEPLPAAAAPATNPPAVERSRSAPPAKAKTSKRPPRPVQRLAGDELLAELFEAFHDLHFLGDALAGAEFVLALVRDKLPAEIALVSFFDINKREFVVVRQDGGATSGVLTRFPERSPIAQSAMRSHRAVVVADAGADPRVGADARFKAIGVDVTSIVCAPVEVGGRYLGVIELLNPLDGGRFTDGDGHAMTYIGQQFAEFVAQHGVVVDPEAILATASKGHRR